MVMYEVYVGRFKSSVGLDCGDLKGVILMLDYFVDLGVDIIWLTPFYPSPLVDNGYDISDYESVDPRFGDIDDFKLLVSLAHDKGLRVVIDVVINHVSDQHDWFLKSQNRVSGYEDLFVWSDVVCNNWRSMFHGSAWTFCDVREQYYLHRFASQQPDLNYTSLGTLVRIIDMLKFWVDLGVDGFRFDVINFLMSDIKRLYVDNDGFDHVQDVNHENTYDIIRTIRRELSDYAGDELIYIGEVGSEDIGVLESYVAYDLMDYVFCFNIASIKSLDVKSLVKEISATYEVLSMPTIFFSSHDMARFKYRLAKNDERVYRMLLELMFCLPGLKVIYQGDEYGQEDFVARDISCVEDILALNLYDELIGDGVCESVAFDKSLDVCRDFSRNMCEFEENDVLEYVKLLVKESKVERVFGSIYISGSCLVIEYLDGSSKSIDIVC